jgi:LAO/AO transport system kinase
MRDLAGDKGVFIRSMASRGALGGLARATSDVVQIFDAVGYDVILIETVGAGQSEVDIARLAHTTLVVDAPGMGDDVQAIKAGILEIADILVVNKADRPGAEITLRVLRNMLDYAHPGSSLYRHPRCPEPEIPLQLPVDSKQELVGSSWTPVVVPTIAIHGDGMDELMQAIQSHHEYIEVSGERNRRDQERLQSRLSALIQVGLAERWRSSVSDEFFQDVFARLAARQISPYDAVQQLLENHH